MPLLPNSPRFEGAIAPSAHLSQEKNTMTGAEEDAAAGELGANARSHPTPTFLDLPPLALRTVCTSFWDDPRALGRLASSTPCLRDLAGEQELWRGYAVARFGKNFLPPPPPIGESISVGGRGPLSGAPISCAVCSWGASASSWGPPATLKNGRVVAL